MAKRYYWLKLSDDFFKSKPVKKLRRIAGGDTYTVIYLKMLLVALKQDGKIYYEGVEDTFADELALDLDEDAENVKVTIAFLKAQNLLVDGDVENEYILPECAAMTGTESDSAERMRRMRERKALQCNDIPSQCYVQASQCYDGATDSYENVTLEKERKKEKNKDINKREEVEEKAIVSGEPISPTEVGTEVMQEVVKAWNELETLGIKTVYKIVPSSKRYGNLRARLKQYGKEAVLAAIDNVRSSSFLCGDNKTGWMITFDWFVLPNNFVKVLEGNYGTWVCKDTPQKKGDDRYDGIKSWAIKNGLNTGEGSVVGDSNDSENSVSDKGFFGF